MIEIYSKKICPYCDMAKRLLDAKGLSYTEYFVDLSDTRLDEMLQRSSGRRTVPQIFINNQGVGGYDDLHRLEQSGALNEMLVK